MKDELVAHKNKLLGGAKKGDGGGECELDLYGYEVMMLCQRACYGMSEKEV
jgi:hypothetical protein